MNLAIQILSITLMLASLSRALASSDDRFIKKYAMMKIYESCFGQEVVKQIRQEMKDACLKCSAPPIDTAPNPSQSLPTLLGKLPLGFAMEANAKPIPDSSESQENDLPSNGQLEMPTINSAKLNPALYAFKQQAFAAAAQSGSMPPYMMSSTNPQYRPYSPGGPFYQLPYANPMIYPPMGYNPYAQQQYPFGQGYYQQPYYGSHRMSRNIDIRDRLDMITRTSGSSGPPKIRNITCVMQELGYLDNNMEPNYEKITQRISNLPVSEELKGDIHEGLEFCRKFSQCVPEVRRDSSPLSRELVKPMFFFRCYKHKKLEACIMKDIRERFTSEDDLETETDFRSIARNGKSLKDQFGVADPQFEALDEMNVYLYDFLSGNNNFDFDIYM